MRGYWNIPDRYKPGIAELIGLDDKQFASLFQALEKVKATTDTVSIVKQLTNKIELSSESLEEIVDCLVSLCVLMHKSSRTSEEIARNVVRTATKLKNVPELSDSDKKKQIDRFVNLLNSDNIVSIAAKAVGLIMDNERGFTRSRIITDLRPVFGDDVSENPVGVVITHNLKLDYHTSNGHKEIYVSLDSDDLQQLKETIKRAEDKEATLQGLLKESDIDLIV